MSISEVLENINLLEQVSNRGYSSDKLILHLCIGISREASCFEHSEVTLQNEVIKQLFGWDRMSASKTFQRYFNNFDLVTNHEVFTSLYKWFFENLKFENYTLDFDSTILKRDSNHEGSKKGYNPQKPEHKSHHPLMAFIADCRMIANFCLGSGNSYTTNNFLSFLEDTLI